MEDESKSLEKKKCALIAEKTETQSSLEKAEIDLRGKTVELRRTMGRIDELQAELDESKRLIEKQRSRIQMLEQDLSNSQKELTDVKQLHCSSSIELEKAARENISKAKCIEETQQEFEVIKSHKKRLETQNSLLDQNCATLKEKLEIAENQIAKLSNELSAERAERLSLSSEYNSIQFGKSDIERKHSQLQEHFQFSKRKITQLEQELEESKRKMFDLEIERRMLHNTIMDLKGNIRVFCRVRPPKIESSLAVEIKDEENLTLVNRNYKTFKGFETRISQFKYDRIYDQESSQEDIFTDVDLMVQSALDGYRVCIFAYGQTGSGKSFTMEGPPEVADNIEFYQSDSKRGIIPRAVEKIFSTMPKFQTSGWSYTCDVCFMEVYMEKVYDLLSSRSEVVLQFDGEQMTARNLIQRQVFQKEDVDSLLVEAKRRRSTSSTNRNEHSSRSHFLFQMNVTGININGKKSFGQINLVDLAGSENVSAAKDSEQKEEGTQIRQSLLALQRVLKNLKQGSKASFRESKLTLLLKDSLTGSSKVLMFLNISPEEDCLEETKNSLSFGAEVNAIQLGQARKKVENC
eukprot:TRINITY_DN8525_c0_g1_i1.p1 TRINITY_DN8525_c0_g1~~TRINITY_DN8525_c0_g1_i1.p1  ORF type:complete len:633 (-),score=185.02 TRINITY_DN8525_c0_g1_i1:22-1752(-)